MLKLVSGVLTTFVYANWRNEVERRFVLPQHVWYGSTEHYPEEGWLVHAYDVVKDEPRDFMLSRIQMPMLGWLGIGPNLERMARDARREYLARKARESQPDVSRETKPHTMPIEGDQPLIALESGETA